MDTPQWRPQEIMVKPFIEEIISTNNTYQIQKPILEIKKPKPQKEQPINCPRCNSINTKFCYYNNYSLTQPRYFCKTCRRYWTQGGSLRNIPVGGGSRKNKRSSNSVFSTSSKTLTHESDLVVTPQNLKIHHNEGQDLNLGLVQKNNNTCVSSSTTSTIASNSHVSAMELLNGISTSSSRGLHSFMPVVQVQAAAADPNTVYSNLGFPLQDFKQVGMNFCLDGFGGSDYASGGVQGETSSDQGRVLFPFEDLKQVSSTNTTLDLDQNNNKVQQGYSNGYWNGMLGGGSW